MHFNSSLRRPQIPRFLASFLSSSFSSSSFSSSSSILLYQYQICPFCCKTKSILNFLQLPYNTIEVNPLTKSQLKHSDYKKVPIAVFPPTTSTSTSTSTINDSAAIINHILATNPLPDNFNNEKAKKWLDWCDFHLAPRIYPAITETFGDSVQTFSYLDHVSTFTAVEKLMAKYVGAFAMVLANGKIKKKYNITDTKLELTSAMDDWVENALNGENFQGGDNASVADVGVYGVLRGLEGAGGGFFNEVVLERREVNDWFRRVERLV